MKAAVFHGPEDMRLQEVPVPRITDHEVLVKVAACAICGSDIRILHNGHKLITPPMITGHEFAGEIVEVGAKVEQWQVGDRITVATSIPCLDCRACKHGRFNICENLAGFGFNYPGGFADYTVIPDALIRAGNLLILPNHLSYREAAISEPLACVIHGQELSGVGPEDIVVVVGAGPIGSMHIALARQRGAAKVIAVEVSAPRLDEAKRMGADVCIQPEQVDATEAVMEETDGWGADVVIVAAGSVKAQESGIKMVARRGRVNLFGGLPKTAPSVQIDGNFVHYNEVFIHGSYGSTAMDHARALELISTKQIDAGRFISRILPFDNILDGFAIAEAGTALKVVLDMRSKGDQA